MAGAQARPEQSGMIGYTGPKKPNPAESNVSDYGNIMAGYGDLAKKNEFTPISYASSPDIANALGGLQTFASTGGYSDADTKNIRERGISPIRSIYANAKQNLNRQRVISGGYSPGYAAAITKMARDSSQQISDVTGNVNANLAERIAQNKLAGNQAYGSLASSEAGRGLDVSKFNAEQDAQTKNRALSIEDAKRGLYGTTPALADLFGRQAMQGAQLNEQGREFDQGQAQRAALDLIARRNLGFRSGDQYSQGGY